VRTLFKLPRIHRVIRTTFAFIISLNKYNISSGYTRKVIIVNRLTVIMLKLAFGSCNKQAKDQQYWDTISSSINPSIFLWMGDTVYSVNNTIEGSVCIMLLPSSLSSLSSLSLLSLSSSLSSSSLLSSLSSLSLLSSLLPSLLSSL